MEILIFTLNLVLGGLILNLFLIPLDYIFELIWFKMCWDEPFTIQEYLKTFR